MREIDFTVDSPNQLYRILKNFPNQDDSEEILHEKESMFHMACEALWPLTFNSSNKTKLELLQLALDYHLKLRNMEGRVNLDFQKFAVYVLKYEHFKKTKIFFGGNITDLSNKTLKNNLLDVGVKCLEQHLGLGDLLQMDVNGEFNELEGFCEEIMEIEGIRAHRITYRLREFSEKRSEEE